MYRDIFTTSIFIFFISTGSRGQSNVFRDVKELLEQNGNRLEDAFDRLSLNDVIMNGQKYKKLETFAGWYFRKNFLTRALGQNGNVYAEITHANVNCFSRYVKRIFIADCDSNLFKKNNFESLKEIDFYCGSNLRLNEELKTVLANVETLKFIDFDLSGGFNETVLKFCKNLKRLYVKEKDESAKKRKSIIGSSDDWLNKSHPTLEYFELNSKRQNDKVITFLKNSPKIRKFSTTIEFLLANMDSISKSKMKLHTLAILHGKCEIDVAKLNDTMQQLSNLQSGRLFQHLNLYFTEISKKHRNIYSLELLSIVRIFYNANHQHNFQLSPLISLKKLYLSDIAQITDFDDTVGRLKTLNYIKFDYVTIAKLLPFVKKFPYLTKIHVCTIFNGLCFDNKTHVLDISAINAVRKKCPNANNLTIYVKENVYLATIRSLKTAIAGSIEIKRIDSDDEVHDFTTAYGTIR